MKAASYQALLQFPQKLSILPALASRNLHCLRKELGASLPVRHPSAT